MRGNIRKHLGNKESWGKYNWQLEPDLKTDMLNRDPKSFTIHGGDELGAGGCIDILHNDEKFRDYITSLKTKVTPVYVHFPDKKITIIIQEMNKK